jgi:hypothetical protein
MLHAYLIHEFFLIFRQDTPLRIDLIINTVVQCSLLYYMNTYKNIARCFGF